MQVPKFTTDESRGDERAVSPVIGVILMVAITVILAAVIGTFVLNLGSQISENVQAGASVSFDSSDHEITITWTSNQNADLLWANTSGATTNTQYKLDNVGDTVVLVASGTDSFDTGTVTEDGGQDFGANNGDEITVIVKAVSGDQATVIINKKDTI